MTILKLTAASRAAEAGYLALADIAEVAAVCGIDYRIVGGQMVSLLVAAAGVPEPAQRHTLDADLAIEPSVASNPQVVAELRARGYETPSSANRFVGTTAVGHDLIIDLLAPSYTGKHRPNRRHGDMTLDEIPGLGLALASPGETLGLEVTMLDGTVLTLTTIVPDPLSALCVKTLGWHSRRAPKDAVDVWRLLRVFRHRNPAPAAWRADGVAGETAIVLRADFIAAGGTGARAATATPAERAEIRALAQHALSTTSQQTAASLSTANTSVAPPQAQVSPEVPGPDKQESSDTAPAADEPGPRASPS